NRAPATSVGGASSPQTDARLGRIVRVLMRFPTVVISGTKLAEEIKTTRSEVWRLVQQLRTLGVEIAGHPSSGYQLTSIPDLLITGRKFCGILTEMSAEATRVRYIVVGIGINVNQREFPDELAQTATSLRLSTGAEWSRVELCAALLKSLDREYKALLSGAVSRADI